jgi:hypothetical protein
MTTFVKALLTIAHREVGVTEVGKSNRGPRVDQYQQATWLDKKDWGAWCAAFVCWVVREALSQTNTKETDNFKRPRTAGAWDFERWSLAQDSTTQTRKPAGSDILPGDLIVFKFSHIGIAQSAPDRQGNFTTIEGNSNSKGSRTGGQVCEGNRNISQVRSRIRFTLP